MTESVNPDISAEINQLVQDMLVPQTVEAVLKFMRQSVSTKRGTANWLYNLRAVGTLLALANAEQYHAISLAVRAATLTPIKDSEFISKRRATSIKEVLNAAGVEVNGNPFE